MNQASTTPNSEESLAVTALKDIQEKRAKYVKRLSQEWKEHGKIIIGLDFDDTISPWKMATIEECNRVIKIVKEAQQTGAYITIHTACSPERYDYIINYCKEKGLEVASVNKNAIALPYGNDTKPYANIFIDDRGGLEESLEILQNAMYYIRGINHSKFITDAA